MEIVDIQGKVEEWRLNAICNMPIISPVNEDLNLQTHVSICVRCRPVLEDENLGIAIAGKCASANAVHEYEAITILDRYQQDVFVHKEEAFAGALTGNMLTSRYRVHRAYGASTTERDLYLESVQPLLSQYYNGRTAWCISYGVTASGKTHTTTSIYRYTASALLEHAQSNGLTLMVSMIELRGDECYDLLSNHSVDSPIAAGVEGATSKVSIREDANGKVHVKCSKHPIVSPQDIDSYLETFSFFRATAVTERNRCSSRSHAIIGFSMQGDSPTACTPGSILANPTVRSEQGGEYTAGTTCSVGVGDLCIVDLAGSERQRSGTSLFICADVTAVYQYYVPYNS